MAMPLAASIDDPPPTATSAATASPDLANLDSANPDSANPVTASAPAARSSVVGLACTPLNVVTCMPASPAAARTAATTGVAASPASVMITAFVQPIAASTCPSLVTLPTPKCAVGVGPIARDALASCACMSGSSALMGNASQTAGRPMGRGRG